MIDSINKLTDTLENTLLQPSESANMEKSERILSLTVGAYVFCKGISNVFSHPLIAVGETLAGSLLLQRGLTGYCPIKAMSEKQDIVAEETLFASGMPQPKPRPLTNSLV